MAQKHKAGFVNIVGNPNVGKSTLMNDLVGERVSIITSKAQTTRHRIMGIVNTPEYQIVFSDTPGAFTSTKPIFPPCKSTILSGTPSKPGDANFNAKPPAAFTAALNFCSMVFSLMQMPPVPLFFKRSRLSGDGR